MRARFEPDFVSKQVLEARRYYLNLNPPTDSELSLVCGGVERVFSNYVVQRKRFAYYAIEMVVEGSGELRLGSQDFPLAAGVVFSYGPTTPHRIANRGPGSMRKYYVDFIGTQAEALLQETGLLGGQPLRVTQLHEVLDLFEMLDREARCDSDNSDQVCAQLLRLILAKIKQRSFGGSLSLPRAYGTYERIREYIEHNYLQLRTIEEVAQHCDLTPIHLSRLFKRFSSEGAYKYLLRKKMNHAAELLLEEQLLIREVAERLGFSDAFQFSRAFKRIYGLPPTELLESAKRQSKSD